MHNNRIFYLQFHIFVLIGTLLTHWPRLAEAAVGPEEQCQYCQKVLFFTFQHFKKLTTKRFLRHKIKHLCNRYFPYRRHCISSVCPKHELVFESMRRSLEAGNYKPLNTCELLKECDKNQSPIDFRVILAEEGQNPESSQVDQEINSFLISPE